MGSVGSAGAGKAQGAVGRRRAREPLVGGLRANDAVAFETLLRRHGPRMLAVAQRILRDEEEARDALQDVLLSVLRSVDSFSGTSLLSTWLHRIVVNACLMRLRAQRRRRLVRYDPWLADGDTRRADSVVVRVGQATTDELNLDRAMRCRRLRAGIDRLPDAYRRLIRLHYLEELTTREIAYRMGCSTNAMKIRLHRARRALKKLVDP